MVLEFYECERDRIDPAKFKLAVRRRPGWLARLFGQPTYIYFYIGYDIGDGYSWRDERTGICVDLNTKLKLDAFKWLHDREMMRKGKEY